MKKKRILAFTSIRSDYDLLSPLFSLINMDSNLELKLIVSGAHLSKTYGYSVKQIEKDCFDILCKIESLIDSDTKRSRVKTASILLQNSIDLVDQYKPDVIMFCGDREDSIVAALIGIYLSIPTIHFYGGDHASDGNVDNPIRHAISKLASVHFVSHDIHRKRLIKLGESPERIFVIGSIAVDKFNNIHPFSIDRIKKHFNIKKDFDEFSLLIFHPIIDKSETAYLHFKNIMEVLKQERINTFVSFPNTDAGNKKIIDIINFYRNQKNFEIYKNLEREWFLSIFMRSKFLIGNSSAGIMEAASIPIPVINVGSRQVGRAADKNVIFCGTSKKNIREAIIKINSKTFQNHILDTTNSYGEGKSAKKAIKLIKKYDFRTFLNKKEDPLYV